MCHSAEAEGSTGFCLMKKNTYFDKKNTLNDSCKGEGFGIQKKSQGKTKENNFMFLKFSNS